MEDESAPVACRALGGRSAAADGGASLPVAAAAWNANIEVATDPT
jgi:hypothetical protein